MSRLILASQSPRRRELLKLLGHPFEVIVSGVEETYIDGESPEKHVTRLSELKANDVGKKVRNGIIIGSDTIVVIDNKILGKPSSPSEAEKMLTELQGRTHRVFTGFALYDAENGHSISGFEKTEVTMRKLDEKLIHQYVQTGEPLDKAGSYGIQGYGSSLVTSIKGCYFTVMGLPLAHLMEALNTFTGGQYGYFGKTQQENM
ncbi:MAG: septum formation inhibitor Maf [Candidatus Latescibacteria bacterium]|nr:septum formation inhibitor Maf [Candidatus Latescibacterota bacterium]